MTRASPSPRCGVVTGSRQRAGLVLLEAALAIVIFALAATIIFSMLRDGVESQAKARQRERMVDLARSALAMIEAGAATAESINGLVRRWPEPFSSGNAGGDSGPGATGREAYELGVQTQPWGTGGLVLVEIRATWRETAAGGAAPARPGEEAKGEQSYTLRQLVRVDRRSVEATGGER